MPQNFQWSLAAVKDKKVFFIDAMPRVDTVTIGEFDLPPIVAVLTTRVRLMNIKRIVLDSLDVLLHLMPDMVVRRREINRLHAWILANKFTAVITAKFGELANTPSDDGALQFLPFIVRLCRCTNPQGLKRIFAAADSIRQVPRV